MKNKGGNAETYLAEVGGFSFIAGFTSGGVPFGLPMEIDKEVVDLNHLDEIKRNPNSKNQKNDKDYDLPF